MLAGNELPLSGLIQQTTKQKKKKKKKMKIVFYFLFITKKRGFDIHAMEIVCMKFKSCFLGRMRKNISKCRLLKIIPRVLGVMVCTNKSRIGLCIAKPTIKLVRRDRSACILSLHISSLIRAFANRMYLLQSLGLIKRLVRWAKTRVNLLTAHYDKSIRWLYVPSIPRLSKVG